MKTLTAMVNLDVQMIKGQLKTILTTFAVFLALSIFMNGTTFISMFPCMSMLYISLIFSIEEQYSLQILHATLPGNRKTAVLARYLFSLLAFLTVVVFSVAASLILGVFVPATSFEPADLVASQVTFLILFVVFISFEYPLLYHLGYRKGRLIGMLPFLLVILAMVPLLSTLEGGSFKIDAVTRFFAFVDAHLMLVLGVIVLVLVVMLTVSYLISCRIYLKKDV